jgi:hypothetical protein
MDGFSYQLSGEQLGFGGSRHLSLHGLLLSIDWSAMQAGGITRFENLLIMT